MASIRFVVSIPTDPLAPLATQHFNIDPGTLVAADEVVQVFVFPEPFGQLGVPENDGVVVRVENLKTQLVVTSLSPITYAWRWHWDVVNESDVATKIRLVFLVAS